MFFSEYVQTGDQEIIVNVSISECLNNHGDSQDPAERNWYRNKETKKQRNKETKKQRNNETKKQRNKETNPENPEPTVFSLGGRSQLQVI